MANLYYTISASIAIDNRHIISMIQWTVRLEFPFHHISHRDLAPPPVPQADLVDLKVFPRI